MSIISLPSPFFSLRHLPSKPSSPPFTITCGPRDNRGPIRRGRTLSTEAILAIQSLKRSSSSSSQVPPSFYRLLLPDLLASISELLRQDLPLLALRLLPLLRSEPSFSPNLSLSLYSDLIKSLARNNIESQLLELMKELAAELDADGGIKGEDLRGPARLVKSLMAAGRADWVMEVYRMMKRGGCVPNDYLFNYIVRGLMSLGEEEGARVVQRDYEMWDNEGEWGELNVQVAESAVPV